MGNIIIIIIDFIFFNQEGKKEQQFAEHLHSVPYALQTHLWNELPATEHICYILNYPKI